MESYIKTSELKGQKRMIFFLVFIRLGLRSVRTRPLRTKIADGWTDGRKFVRGGRVWTKWMSKIFAKSFESAVSCLPTPNSNAEDITISNPQLVTKRMIDFYDQTLDFLLIMQSMLKDFKPSNSGLEVYNRSRITKWLKIAVFVLKIAIQLKWWSKTWTKTWIKNWSRSRNEDQKITIQRVV